MKFLKRLMSSDFAATLLKGTEAMFILICTGMMILLIEGLICQIFGWPITFGGFMLTILMLIIIMLLCYVLGFIREELDI